MAMRKIKSGDEVIVLAGKCKNMQGKVTRVVAKGQRAYVDGINMVKKHVRPNPQANQPGGIIEKEAPIAISNLALYNPSTKKADRVGIKTLDDGRKVRYFKSNDEVIDI